MEEIARSLAADLDLAHTEAAQIVRKVFATIEALLRQEGEVRVGGFGTFAVKKRRARRGRNPRTGERLLIPEQVVVTFRPARDFSRRFLSPPDAPSGA
jgi:nucleoid DNA-binding protein